MDQILDEDEGKKDANKTFQLAFDVQYARHGLRYIVETLGKVVDCAVV